MSSVERCIDILNERLQQIEFGDSTIEKAETASEAELHHFFRHILKIDDTMTPDITTKQQLSRHPKLFEWEKVHVISIGQYDYQMKNCDKAPKCMTCAMPKLDADIFQCRFQSHNQSQL